MRFTLSKSEILRGHKSFTRVITAGLTISAPPIRCYYSRDEGNPPTTQVGFAVTRNIKRAVDRNKAKRLMREAYRLNVRPTHPVRAKGNGPLDIVFMYIGSPSPSPRNIVFKDVETAMKKLISMIFDQGGE